MKLLTRKPVLVLLVLVPVAVVLILVSGGGDDKQASEPNIGTVSAASLRVGDCISNANMTAGDDVKTFDAVTCDKPHDGEVYTVIVLEGEKYPGKTAVKDAGQRGCRARLRRQATSKALREKEFFNYKYSYPTAKSWAQGEREITCLATYLAPQTGKLQQRQRQ